MMADTRKIRIAKDAMAAFEASPSAEALAAVAAAIEPVRAEIEQTDDWRGNNGKDGNPIVLGWPERNKAAIAQLQNEARAEKSAKLEAAAQAKADADREATIAFKTAIAEEDRKRRSEDERRNATRRLRRVTMH